MRHSHEHLAALLTQKNIEEAARSIGIGHATLLRWLKEPEFDGAYREARRAAFRQSVARLQQASAQPLLPSKARELHPSPSQIRA